MELIKIITITIIISGILVIASPNPVHSVFHLIFVFIQMSIYYFTFGIEFMGIIFIIVYVGAIAILFLFVVMLLNIKLIEMKEIIIGLPIASIFGIGFIIIINKIMDRKISYNYDYKAWDNKLITEKNFKIIGEYLYNEYYVPVIIAAIVLLIATIGAVYLTMTEEKTNKRQKIAYQYNVRRV